MGFSANVVTRLVLGKHLLLLLLIKNFLRHLLMTMYVTVGVDQARRTRGNKEGTL